jgi:hypothetical protein
MLAVPITLPDKNKTLPLAVPQLPERCLSRKAGIVRHCLYFFCLLKVRKPFETK